jgi:HlyD family secretion protein
MADASTRTSEDVRRTIGKGHARGARKWLLRAGLLLVVLGVVAGVIVWRRKSQAAAGGPSYVTEPAKRGNLRALVTATGNLRALDQVDVGAEVSGTILSVAVDFNDLVKKGDVLCELDPEQLSASRDQARAQLTASQADLQSRIASAKEAKLTAERSRELQTKGLISSQELEAAVAAAARADAARTAAVAQVNLAQASLKSAETALRKSKIVSPIDGIVLSRTVEPGQTVAASFQAPVLFTLARNLTQMELRINVDEADIGRVHEGQAASFTVDAYPARTFPAKLQAIHNIATTVDNVVTYQAVLVVDNEDKALRPGMTATVTIVTATRDDVLLVPNAALRFTPPEAIHGDRGGPRLFSGKRDPKEKAEAEKEAKEALLPTVWTLSAGKPTPHRLEIGMSDGEHSEVVKGDVEAGDELLVDMTSGPP